MDAGEYAGTVRSHVSGHEIARRGRGAYWPDERLVQVAKHGDTTAFNVLVDRYNRQVYGIAYRICGPAEAEDITQDVFIRAFRGLRDFRYRDRASFHTWLFRIAVNTSINELRKRKRRRRMQGPSLNQPAAAGRDDVGSFIGDDSQTPHRVAQRREQRKLVHTVLAELPQKHRIALTLVDLQGMRYREAAETIGCPLGTLKSRLARAREMFARAYSACAPTKPSE